MAEMNEHSSPSQIHILVIDDSKIDRFIVEKFMERVLPGGRVVQKESAAEGLDYLNDCLRQKSALPRLVFLDINMPGMSGFGFLDEFEKFPEEVKNTCNIVMLSSSLNEEDYKKSMAYATVKMYCNKPVNTEALREVTHLL